jgi:methyltransferase
MMLPLVLLAVAFVPMVLEARLSSRNARALVANGAVEPARDTYAVMQFIYPACFLMMIGDAWIHGTHVDGTFAYGAAVFAIAKGLKYWAIATLGPRWTFRVLVPPGSTRVTSGPYRFLAHPNYLAIGGELIGMALMAHAPISGLTALIGFGLLVAARIRVEERALGSAGRS